MMEETLTPYEQLALVSELTTSMAHDLNNILTSIIGYTELLRREPCIAPSSRQDLQQIIVQGQRATHLVRQILELNQQFSNKSGQNEPKRE